MWTECQKVTLVGTASLRCDVCAYVEERPLAWGLSYVLACHAISHVLSGGSETQMRVWRAKERADVPKLSN